MIGYDDDQDSRLGRASLKNGILGSGTGKWVVAAVFVLVAGIVFLFQVDPVLFGEGHLGWVSAHTLAIIRNATPERWFLGFTCEFADARGYSYFDRYPVLFSGVMNRLLYPFSENSADYIAWARLWMNVIYLGSMLVGYKIVRLITGDRYVALLATLFTFMGVFFVFYKEMVHFDQPAILGMLVLFYGITRYEMDGDGRWVWLGLVAVLLGRGYASNFLLLLWNLIWVARSIVRREFRIAGYLRSLPFAAFVAGGILSAGALGFNVVSESRIQQVPWYETSIIKSATFRLNLSGRPSSPEAGMVRFATEQAKRTVGGFVPYAVYPYRGGDRSMPNLLLVGGYLLALGVLMVWSLLRTDLASRVRGHHALIILGILAGYFWLFPMRNLAAYHNYTHMYNVLFYLLMFSAAFYWLKGRGAATLVVAVGVVLFALSHWELAESRKDYNLPHNDISGDVDRIRQYLRQEPESVVYIPEGYRRLVDGTPYAACFYFSGYTLDDEPSAVAAIVTRRDLGAQSALPDLQHLKIYSPGSSAPMMHGPHANP